MKSDVLLLPNSTFLFAWAFFFSLFVLVYFGIAFFAITFQTQLFDPLFNSTLFSILLLAIVGVDIIILLNTAFIKNGKLIKERKINIHKYLESKAFWIDVFIMFVFVLRIVMSDKFANQQQILAVLNLFIVFKFYKIHYYGARFKFYYFNERALLLYEFIKYTILLGLLCHVVGCLFFTIDFLMIQAQWYPIEQHWLISASAMPGLYYAPLWQQYLYSFYFANVTLSTIAYGDITPKNPSEVIFVLALQAFLLLTYAYVFTQIYDVITWYNRKRIKVKETKMKVSSYLKRQKINKNLMGRMVAEIQYKQLKKQAKKHIFTNEISASILDRYNRTGYTHEADKFMPRFIRRANFPTFQFNELITEQFVAPDNLFQAVNERVHESYSDRKIFYIAKQTILRKLVAGSMSIVQQASNHRWLGIHTFITCQMDKNECWYSQMPLNILVLKFSKLKSTLAKYPSSYEIFQEQCHKTIQLGGSSEDLQKCLLCGNDYHSTLNCRRNRKDNHQILVRQYAQTQQRKFIKRNHFSTKKIHQLKGKRQQSFYEKQYFACTKQVQVQTELQVKQMVRINYKKQVEKMWSWKNYMPQSNFISI